ncbi:Pentapeptide repeat-containing protein [Actinopolyspora mzabensis]|uniref:Pentapeptide repeat-containing protein n=1 Tax=Actinopolyspora mzabensis TaxID=995066 RepID=A0A1G8WNB5_ACTMZ|nr:pentapeptide repeat-containing protein [Actinopolyspora mzabensis]SDJ79878.1 Pentapeptide repeat-containing protein [Actinopolyspora mzabensis]
MSNDPTTARRTPVMPGWTIWVGALVLVLVAGLSMWLLLESFGSGSARDKTRLEAVKVAGGIVLGTGGGVALLLAARRQRATELSLDQKERAAADARHDATERRVTELYAAAAEQLGSDKAPVRLAALYALERLGQNNPAHRQTVVDLFCAYLRMPFTPADPEQPEASGTRSTNRAQRLGLRPPTRRMNGAHPSLLVPINGLEAGDEQEEQQQEEQQQEEQVRRTAQRLIWSHLRPDPDASGEPSNPKFWHEISLDLTTATLQDWNLVDCRVRHVRLDRARFLGPAAFDRAEFTGQVRARETVFQREAWFADTTFRQFVRLDRAEFHAEADFDRAVFEEWLSLAGAVFHGSSSFRDVRTADSGWEAPSKPSFGESPPLPGSVPGEYERPGVRTGQAPDTEGRETRDQLAPPDEPSSAAVSAGNPSTSDSRDTIRRMQG